MDNLTPLMSERFELLSAYLDGEVSSAERKQVETWLSTDAELQQTYRKMLTLQSGFKSMPVEAGVLPTDQFVDQVMKRLDRRPKLWVWGGLGAAAAIVVGAFSGLMGNQGVFEMAQKPSSNLDAPQTAFSPVPATKVAGNPNGSSELNDPSALMIALDRPPVVIPAVPASMTTKSSDLDSATDFRSSFYHTGSTITAISLYNNSADSNYLARRCCIYYVFPDASVNLISFKGDRTSATSAHCVFHSICRVFQ